MNSSPVAWIYELATVYDSRTDEYLGWKKYVSETKPIVPEGSIRNLRPLYEGPAR